MTEAQWRRCDCPRLSWDFVAPRTTDRKLRLFACAYFRALEGWDSRLAKG
jgi:hypothetical protein